MSDAGPVSVWGRFKVWSRRYNLGRQAAIFLIIAALLSVFATYGVISGSQPFTKLQPWIKWFLLLDLILILTLAVVVMRRIVEIWLARRRRQAGARLQIRLVMWFGAVAVIPAMIIALVAALFINFRVDFFFSDVVGSAIENSRIIAEAYFHDQQLTMRADLVGIAQDLSHESPSLLVDASRLNTMLSNEVSTHLLREAIVFDRAGRVYGRSAMAFALEFGPLPLDLITEAEGGDAAISVNERGDQFRALLALDRNSNVFLYIAREADPSILSYVEQTRRAIAQYHAAKQSWPQLELLQIALVFGALALLLLLAAAWAGLTVATQLARPITRLISAAERVRGGDLAVRVDETQGEDEISTLSRAFNRMTSQIDTQRTELIEANLQLDLRRRFTETVLAGVSAGVIGLDRLGQINLPNRSASELLGIDLEQSTGIGIESIVPEMAGLLKTAMRRPDRRFETQLKIMQGSKTRTLLTRISAEMVDGEVRGYVVTFDDISELLAAQRTAAWADIARRIAHEIKNPLTPIQLSAERLQRKYLSEITTDPETFKICTETIVRQVGDIGRMVDEFSAFARMPAPIMKLEDLALLAREALFLIKNGNPEIEFSFGAPSEPFFVTCDARQIRQALINLLHNAVDAIYGRSAEQNSTPGMIRLDVTQSKRGAVIEIIDNGKGLPPERDRLTEPYITTREKGTGLGLAIVKKIMEDHNGEIILEDAPRHFAKSGAKVTVVIPTTLPEAASPNSGMTTFSSTIDRDFELSVTQTVSVHGA